MPRPEGKQKDTRLDGAIGGVFLSRGHVLSCEGHFRLGVRGVQRRVRGLVLSAAATPCFTS